MTDMLKKHKNLIRTVLFLLIFSLIFIRIQKVFRNKDVRFFQSVTVLKEEKPGTVDAVYIGSSNVHCFWIPLSAWQNHGISVLSLTSNSMPIAAWPYMIDEVRKTQPDALIILNLNSFKEDNGPNQVNLHRIADYMPFSLNKLKMIRDLSEDMGFGFAEQLEFYLPIVRFHSKWSSLDSSDFRLFPDRIKGGLIYLPHWKYIWDMSQKYERYSKEKDLTQRQGKDLVSLVNYLDRVHPNVLFVTVPQSIEDKTAIGQINKIETILKDHGYSCLDLLNEPEKASLVLDRDFYDKGHTNVHGALKFTEFFARYLIDNYGFKDKRGSSDRDSWDIENERYNEMISPYTLPFERNAGLRDCTLAAPEEIRTEIRTGEITVSWTSSEGADAYQVYRKNADDSAWELLEQKEGNVLSVTDKDLLPGREYTYTVVPVRIEDDNDVYGNFSYRGISAAAE